MAVDSILSTLGAEVERVGYLESNFLLPISGCKCALHICVTSHINLDFSCTDDRSYPEAPVTLCLPAEVYIVNSESGTPTFIIQQRCPVVAGKQKEYIKELLDLLSSFKYNLALILTGASSRDDDEEIGGYSSTDMK